MTLEGIDVSTYQGAPDWGAVAAAGISFAFAKVSEGAGFEDPSWAYNAGPLAAPGPILPGAYHFARPDLGNTPEAEADWFWSRLTARVDPHGWLLALDLEAGSGDLSGWRDRWCARVRDLSGGYLPGWYTFWDFALNHGLNHAADFWAWFAWPDSNGALPATAFAVSMQQYGMRAVSGIGGQVDADRFFGDASQLARLTVGGGGDMPLDPKDPVVVGLEDRIGSLEYGLNPSDGYNSQGELTSLIRRIDQNVMSIGPGLAAAKAELDALTATLGGLKAELDQVAAAQAGGTPADLGKLQAAVGAVDGHVKVLGGHLGVDVTTGAAT